MVRHLLAALLLVGLAAAPALAQTIRLAAGNGTATHAGDGSPAPFASINNPVGIHGDATGQIWIADAGNHAVRRVTAAWDTIVTYAGTGGTAGYTGDGAAATSATLNGPTDVFVDSSGVVWIADTGNHVIRRVTAAGVISTVAGTGTAGFSGDGAAATSATLDSPSGVYVTNGGVIYIADRGNHRIRRVDAGGTITTFAGTGANQFSGDGGLATEADLNSPTDVYIDTSGVLYIADTNNHRIRAVATDSTISTVAGTGSAGFSGDGNIATGARLAFPRAVFTDTAGVLYIADRFNHHVRRIDTGGNITTLAGDGVLESTGTGDAVNVARLASPSGVWLHDDRHLFVSEAAAHRVRRALDDNIHALTDTTTIGRGGEVQILTAAFTGDGSTAVKGIRLTVSDLSTASGIDSTDFVDFRLYESPDSLFSSTDTLLATVPAHEVTLGQSFTVQTTTASPVPGSGQRRFYLVTARIADDAVEGHSFRVGFPTGGLSTTIGAHAMRRLASDTDRVTIDVVATRLVFTTQPDGVIADNPLVTQPVLEAIDDLGFIDSDFSDTITLTLSGGSGTLLQSSVTAVAGVATFSNVAYSTSTDQESFALVADDEAGGAEGDLPTVTSNTLTANTQNDPPVVTAFNFTINEDDSVTVPITSLVSDVDDSLSSLTLTFEASNTQIAFDGTDVVIRPDANFAGLDTLIITAEDPFGTLSSDTSVLTVVQINDTPVLTPLGRRSADEDDTVRVDMRAQISDVETPFEDLRWIIDPSPGLQVSLSSSTGILQAWTTPDSAGVFTLRLVGIDESNLSSASLDTIEIVSVNDLPVLDLPALELARDSTEVIELTPLVTDVEHEPASIQFQLGEALGLTGSVDDDRLTVTADGTLTGAAYLIVVATDPDGGVGSDTLHVDVFSGEPQPPQFAAIADRSVEAGASLWIDLRALVTDPDHDFEQLILTSSVPAIGSVSVSGDSLLVATVGIDAYSIELILTATDPDGLQAEAPVAIDVTEVPAVLSALPDSIVIDIDGGELRLDNYVSSGVDPTAVEWTIAGSGAIDLVLDVDTRIVTILPVDGSRDGGQISIIGTGPKRADADSLDIVVANFPPVVDLPDLFVGTGESAQLLLDDFVSDDDDVSLLRWDATPLDAGLSVSVNQAVRALTLSAASGASGDLRIAVTATDAQLATGLDTIVVSVRTADEPGDTTIVDTTGTNVAPVVDAFPQLTFQIGSSGTVQLDDFVSDDDPVEQIRWSAEAGAGVSATISDERLLSVESVGDFDGTTSIRLTATDVFGGRDSGTLVVTVQPLVEAPTEGDFDANGQVDLDDFFNLVDHLGLSVFAPGFDRRFDLDADGRVGFDDFFLFVDLYERARMGQ